MTGFGKAEGTFDEKNYSIEIRSVNSRYCEVSFKYPKSFSGKELELKEIIRKKISRGKIFAILNVDGNNGVNNLTSLNKESIKAYVDFLKSVRKAIGSKEKIKLEHIIHFTDLLKSEGEGDVSKDEFEFVYKLLNDAIDDLKAMKIKEGEYLKSDTMKRINILEKENDELYEFCKNRLSLERGKFNEKVLSLLEDKSVIDEKRLELEVVLLVEKMDFTEECIRLKSHLKYFRDFIETDEYAGRRLNFLLQEMNREINTMSSKAMDAVVSQKVSLLKEELEKIREQIQNIE